MSHYAVEIDLANPNTSHTQVVDLVGPDKRVLDVGCWTGDLGAVLKTRGCTVDGFEIDEAAAAIAVKRLDHVVQADLERTSLTEQFEPGSYDVVIFADVLEHLTNPAAALREAKTLLKDGGQIVVSIPNITHGSVRLALLQGVWRTTDTGLLDHTHIRFYSRAGLLGLMQEAGLVVEALRGTTADPLNVEVEIDVSDLPEQVIEWVRDQPDAFVYQFQLAARPLRDGEAPGTLPEITLGADVDAVRPHDAHTEARIRAGRDALIMKDHVLGLQAAATSARARADKQLHRAKRLREKLDRVLQRNRRLKDRVADLETQLARPAWRRAASRVKRTLRG